MSFTRTLRLEKLSQASDKKTNSIFISAFKVFKHASWVETCYFSLGCILATINGAFGWPFLTYFLANFSQDMSNILKKERSSNSSFKINFTNFNSSLETEWKNAILKFTYPAVASIVIVFFNGYLCMLIFNYTAERFVFRLKKLYIKSLLKQPISWFDKKTHGYLISTISKNFIQVQTALGDKLGLFVLSITEVIVSLIVCFWNGWQLTLAIFCLYPFLIATTKLTIVLKNILNKIIIIVNLDLTQLLQEVVTAIRTVYSFGGEEEEVKRFVRRLRISRWKNIKQGIISGINSNSVVPITQCFIALCVWYGVKLMEHETVILNPKTEYSVQNIILIATLVIFSTFLTRQAIFTTEILNIGFRASTDIINVIENKHQIDDNNNKSQNLQNLNGNIEFNKVSFRYPSTYEEAVLKDINLSIKAGETIAIVGPSGGGKSTILQLLQRFYDPQEGQIFIDGLPLMEFNIGWLRRKIGVVNQQPHLFNTTIKENIKFGNEDASDEDIIQAAKDASAHDFIINLPQQYNTIVGDQGSLLSGGQKQRIAIARALIRNPAILLLDEVTSALDKESEAKIQDSLEKARKERTIIIVSHRLNTVHTADQIIGIKNGKVVEKGSHEELIATKGLYYQLLQAELNHKKSDKGFKSHDEEDRKNFKESNQLKLQENSEKLIEERILQELPKKSRMQKDFLSILKLCKNDCFIVASVIFFSVASAFLMPIRAFALGNLFNIIEDTEHNTSTQNALYWSEIYILLGFLVFISTALKMCMQSFAEENLLLLIRQRILETILKQEVGWFDEPERDVGNLCSLVIMDVENVKPIPGAILGSLVYTSLATIFIIAFSTFVQWKMALVVMIPSIGMSINYYVKEKLDLELILKRNIADIKSNNLAIEAVRNFRTVVALHIQELIAEKYNNLLGQPNGLSNKLGHLRAFSVAASDVLPLMSCAIVFAYGGYLMSINEVNYSSFYMMCALLINNFSEVSMVFSAMPSYTKACMSAKQILELFRRKPLIDNSKSAGIQLPNTIKPQIEFQDVTFAYPTRPEDIIFKNFNLEINNGDNIAIVGESGCGKSTILQLLLRFYDPAEGQITINGYDIRSINLPNLRSLIAVVSQEPILFNRTIGENIAYGNNSRKIEMDEIINASKLANIHQFITTLQEGYNTVIGGRGVELSGGQKQRVAIARALIKNPKILLLDEATSALDNESEIAVQQSLEKVQKNRTCITIAHRMSSIQNADKHVVFSKQKNL